jgi:hypothetical protein
MSISQQYTQLSTHERTHIPFTISPLENYRGGHYRKSNENFLQEYQKYIEAVGESDGEQGTEKKNAEKVRDKEGSAATNNITKKPTEMS